MENLEALDARASLQVDESILSSGSFKENEYVGNDAALNEKFILENLDSYWEDLRAHLIVSRMVSDSVIKGIINAVREEAAEKISSKETEIALLSERLLIYESGAAKAIGLSVVQEQPKGATLGVQSSTEHATHLTSLNTAAEKQLQKLKNGIEDIRNPNSLRLTNLGSGNSGSPKVLHHEKVLLDGLNQMNESVDVLQVILASVYEEIGNVASSLKDSLNEKQWRWEFEKEIDFMIVKNFTRGLQEEYELIRCEQQSLFNDRNKNWSKKADELLKLRQVFDSVSKSLLSFEPGYLFSHGSHENFEELNTAKRGDHYTCKVLGNHLSTGTSNSEEKGVTPTEKSEKPLLMRMTKEELIDYYKTKIIKMKRQQESALHDKTEELFSLKRELLKEKGSSHFRKDKEFEALGKKIQEVIINLDHMLMESEMFPAVQDDHNKMCSLKDRRDSLLLENQHLYDVLTDNRKEIKCLVSQVSEAGSQMSNHSSAEVSLLREIKKLEDHVEDMNMEAFIRDKVNRCVLRESIGEVKCHAEDLEMETEMFQEFCCIILRGFVGDVNCAAAIKPIMMEHDREEKCLDAVLLEKEKALNLEIEKIEKVEKHIASLSTLIKEKEKALGLEVEKTERLKQDNASLLNSIEQKDKFAAEAGSTLKQQKEQFEIVSQEVDLLRDQASKQEILILEDRKESNILKGRLDGALEQIHQYKVELSETNQKFWVASNQLKEAEKQKAMLHDIIQKKQMESIIISLSFQSKTASAASRENEQRKQMESIIISIQQLSKAVAQFESRMTESIERKNSRLEILSYECGPLVKQADFLQKKGLWYKQRLEMRSSDHKKAEIEVDLLGDEVDALLGLFEKIYITLDHYSPVLCHYPGVMEILTSIKRELKGNS